MIIDFVGFVGFVGFVDFGSSSCSSPPIRRSSTCRFLWDEQVSGHSDLRADEFDRDISFWSGWVIVDDLWWSGSPVIWFVSGDQTRTDSWQSGREWVIVEDERKWDEEDGNRRDHRIGFWI